MSYQTLKLNGSGYASIADGFQAGLDVGLSDFMVEMRVKLTVPTADQPEGLAYLFSKTPGGAAALREAYINVASIGFDLWDGGNFAAIVCSSSYVDDLKWHSLFFVGDRDQVTGLELYVDGVEAIYIIQNDLTAIDNLDNAGEFTIGSEATSHDYKLKSKMDEIRIWNFGKDGLPADYAAYIAWRARNRNWFRAVSEYSGGAWLPYDDANWTNPLINPDMEALNSWANRGAPTTNARSGVQAHSGANSRLIVSNAVSQGAYQDIVTIVGHWYEVSGWIWVTAGDAEIGKEDTDGSDQVLTAQATLGAWHQFCVVFQATATTSRIFFQSDATAVSTFYVDDMRVVQTGLTGYWRFNNNYLDETVNSNNLTAGGLGNIFPTYSLKTERIIIAGAVNPVMGARR